jgi:hypothetical protein
MLYDEILAVWCFFFKGKCDILCTFIPKVTDP